MAAAFISNTSHYGPSSFGDVRIVYGTILADGTTASCAVGLRNIYHAQVKGQSATTSNFQKVTWTNGTLSIASCTAGDVYTVFAIGS